MNGKDIAVKNVCVHVQRPLSNLFLAFLGEFQVYFYTQMEIIFHLNEMNFSSPIK